MTFFIHFWFLIKKVFCYFGRIRINSLYNKVCKEFINFKIGKNSEESTQSIRGSNLIQMKKKWNKLPKEKKEVIFPV